MEGIGGSGSHLSDASENRYGIAVQLAVDTQYLRHENTRLLCPRRGTQAANGGRL